jgi:RNA polymerase sigma factor (sigma-70 family)
MLTDIELLRRYTAEGSEAAFRELVTRHLHLVYSSALRFVGGDEHRARDVAQTVFTDLARKAARLCDQPLKGPGGENPVGFSVSGWLYTSARFAAAKSIRAEQTRRKYEQAAHAMNDILNGNSPEPDWSKLRYALDDAMSGLSSEDREAVLLRFFEQRSLAETGRALGCQEDAARKRVNRALEKLRGLLARGGVTSTAEALALALGQHTIGAAPADLAASLATNALAGAAASAKTILTVNLIKLMISTKIKSTAGILLLAGLLTSIVTQQRALSGVRQETETLRRSMRNYSAPSENSAMAAEKLVGAEAEELARLRKEHGQLLRLRGEIGRRLRAAEAQAAFDRNVGDGAQRFKREVIERERELKQCTERKLAGGFKLAEAQNAGMATPEATLQTLMYALAHDDASTLGEIQWPGVFAVTFPPDKWQQISEQQCAALRGEFAGGVSALQLRALRTYAPDRVEVIYDYESAQPRELGRPSGGGLLLRQVDGQWMMEHPRATLPGDLEQSRSDAPIITPENP